MPKIDFEDQQPLVLYVVTKAQLEDNAQRGAALALAAQKEHERTQKRLNTADAAKFLGCSTYHLQGLHKQGLPYEKGRPNYYRLGDLEALQKSRRLNLNS
ncbi:helix-turn-helix domain-containing protein [Hymenobacter sp. BRD128]|uniref:helix-turn-helix domain-containing protein n=1 Tax=Hymenobacter sp. BRD128 TaxID=2675878 RepID=UPI001563456F|nr:helix-turn-helix domain-containing protein [Hymenobacter sp. BRD128]QKG56975.1 helix-turn-helix domain-containing protein [Hymenobacter sp. BRD128]